MSKTLNLVDHLVSRGRTFQQLGRTHDAQRIFSRLAGFRELPAEVAHETQKGLAEIHLQAHQYAGARRHLAAALTHCPDNAQYHYLMAMATERDEEGDTETACEHYRKSLEIDPQQPRCLGDFGLLALSLGHVEAGLEALRRAVELDPDQVDTITNLAEGLHMAGRPEEARLTLRAAMFRNPRSLAFRKLWRDFQFQQLHEEQQAACDASLAGTDAGDEPSLLPFVPPAGGAAASLPSRKIIRKDGPASPAPPHTPRPSGLPGRKRA